MVFLCWGNTIPKSHGCSFCAHKKGSCLVFSASFWTCIGVSNTCNTRRRPGVPEKCTRVGDPTLRRRHRKSPCCHPLPQWEPCAPIPWHCCGASQACTAYKKSTDQEAKTNKMTNLPGVTTRSPFFLDTYNRLFSGSVHATHFLAIAFPARCSRRGRIGRGHGRGQRRGLAATGLTSLLLLLRRCKIRQRHGQSRRTGSSSSSSSSAHSRRRCRRYQLFTSPHDELLATRLQKQVARGV
jgi:hypothetical protein